MPGNNLDKFKKIIDKLPSDKRKLLYNRLHDMPSSEREGFINDFVKKYDNRQQKSPDRKEPVKGNVPSQKKPVPKKDRNNKAAPPKNGPVNKKPISQNADPAKKPAAKNGPVNKGTPVKKEQIRKDAPHNAPVKKAVAAKKAVVTVNAENAGFKAGDVYQALAAAEKALTVKEIAKAAKISEEETLLGLGWLFKEGKLNTADEKITLA